MPRVETVLAKGGTSPIDFTLHDADHSYRVAQRMAELIPSDVLQKLTSYELALLLLAAYLHDIGMTPEQRKVRLHYEHLLTGQPQDLIPEEIAQFQEWLDNHAQGATAPIAKEPLTPDSLRLARELVAHYCRYRHNDWSEAWMRSNLINETMGTYVDWLSDLLRLSRSHHQGYHELVRAEFNPRLVGSPSSIVHLRYLAVVLRVADVLDFDPERTPEVILRHRDISLEGLIYWWKDPQISFEINANGIVISARPSNARIHRAIEATVQDVERELQLARRLADETHFEKTPFPHPDLPHRWTLPSSVHHVIEPKDNAYVYVDGSFRPNTSKFLELLSGLELYGTPLAALREVLQNSFDAVREQIAYERLEETNPNDPDRAKELAKHHYVKLRFESLPGSATLTCSDTGVGMTKGIICEHLLVSGTPARHDVLELERKCRASGFALGRTGQFGIGVLTYFMLADRVAIRTRRSQDCGDSETNGWCFETEGIGSFGELRPAAVSSRGTEVTLHLRPETVGEDPGAWLDRVRSYLKEALVYIPCNFQFTSNLLDSTVISLPPGWAATDAELAMGLLGKEGLQEPQIDQARKNVMSARQLRQMEVLWQQWVGVRTEAVKSIRWHADEGELPDHLGRFRIHVPYFSLPGGFSLGFLRVREYEGRKVIDKIGWGDALVPRTFATWGWKGMRVAGKDLPPAYQQAGAIIEVNWGSSDAGKIAVSRSDLTLSKEANNALTWLQRRAVILRNRLLDQIGQSDYATLNCRLSGVRVPFADRPKWISIAFDEKAQTTTASWEELSFPAVTMATFERLSRPMVRPRIEVAWKGNKVALVPSLATQFDPSSGLAFNPPNAVPKRIVAYGDPRLRVAAIWEDMPQEFVEWPSLVRCEFPPEWHDICMAEIANYSGGRENARIWNREHPLAREFTQEGWQWILETMKDYRDPITHKADLLARRCRIAAWLVGLLWHPDADGWQAIRERDPGLLTEAWRVLFGQDRTGTPPQRPLCLLWEMQERFLVITPDSWQELTDCMQIRQYLPVPGPDWRLEVTEHWDLPSAFPEA